jgi:streptothricin acetyltransferase
LRAIETWARLRHCSELKVETQNTNLAACRLYAQQGFRLVQANHDAYPELPGDVQLIWRKVVDG